VAFDIIQSTSRAGLVTFEIRGIQKYMNQFSPERFRRVFNKYMNVNLRSFAYKTMKTIMEEIHNGSFAPLGIQRYIKGSSSVLIETGDLKDHGIGWKFKKSQGGTNIGLVIGARDGIHSPSGLSYPKLIDLIQKGTSFTPTLSQRIALAMKAKDKAPPPLGEKKEVWTIPPRPFLSKALAIPKITPIFKTTVQTSLTSTLKELMK
jgi:hypothetical protein